MSPTTAIDRYVFNNLGAICQFLYNQLAETNLPTSNVLAIKITGKTAAPNSVLKPTILYQAATPAIDSAVNNVMIAKITKKPPVLFNYTYLPEK